MLEIDNKSVTEAIAKIKREYDHISGDILNQAISRALNRTASTTKKFANQQIRQKYNIGASKLNNEFRQRYSSKNTLHAEIIAKGAPLSLTLFGAKQEGKLGTTSFNRKGVASTRLNRKSRNNAIKGVSVQIKKGGKLKNIPTAFIQTSNGGLTVFARGTAGSTGQGFQFAKERLPIGKLTTSSVPLMFGNSEVMNPSMNKALQTIEERITHEITWLLSK